VNPVQRLAILGAGGAHRDEEAYARAASRLGVTSRVFDVLGVTRTLRILAPPLLERQVEAFAPDFILCTRDAQRIGAARLDRLFRNRQTAMWHVDIAPQAGVIELARRCGTLFITYSSQQDAYRAAGVDAVHFMPQAMDIDRDIPAAHTRDEYRCDVSFVGSGPYPYRWPLLRAVASNFALQIRGPGWNHSESGLPVAGKAVHGADFAEVVAGAAVSLGANSFAEQEVEYASASNRMWKIFGCGGAYVGPRVPGIEQFAQSGEHCQWFSSVDEAVAQIRALKENESGRRAMAERAHRHALAHHTYEDRMARLLRGESYPLS
jgi:Glycosyl transferases group 1/DUF based on E. rectale Gene description (DUF3880)